MQYNVESALKKVKTTDVPSSTLVKVENVLRNLEHRKGEEHMKPRYKKSLVIAAAITAMLLVTTTALAVTNAWGVMDYITGKHSSGDVLPNALGIVQRDVPQSAAQSDLATFAVRDAIFNGDEIYIAFTVTPVKKDTLLITALDYAPDDPINVLGSIFENYSGTIAEYAAANGMALVWAGIGGIDGGWDCQMESDGTLVIIVNTHYEGVPAEALDLELPCFLTPVFSEEADSNQPIATLSFTLDNSGHFSEVSSAQAVEFTDVGIRIDTIALSASEVSVNVRVEYSVVDQEKFDATDGGLWFEFLADKYESLPLGPEQRLPDGPGGAQITPLDGTNTRFVQEWSLAAMENLPERLIVRGFNAWEKNRYETHTIEISN